MATNSPKPITRIPRRDFLLRRIEKTRSCWIWRGARNSAGYGVLDIGRGIYRAHRIVYAAFVGPIPDGMLVLHRCDNPPCVNPAHLFIGTHADNVQDMLRKGRHVSHEAHKTHCPQGHEYTPENTYVWGGKRDCRACNTLRVRSRKAA